MLGKFHIKCLHCCQRVPRTKKKLLRIQKLLRKRIQGNNCTQYFGCPSRNNTRFNRNNHHDRSIRSLLLKMISITLSYNHFLRERDRVSFFVYFFLPPFGLFSSGLCSSDPDRSFYDSSRSCCDSFE